MNKSNWTDEQVEGVPVPLEDYKLIKDRGIKESVESLVRLHLRDNNPIAGSYRNGSGEKIGEFISYRTVEHGFNKVKTLVELADAPDIKYVYATYFIGDQKEWLLPDSESKARIDAVVVKDRENNNILDWNQESNSMQIKPAQNYADKTAAGIWRSIDLTCQEILHKELERLEEGLEYL